MRLSTPRINPLPESSWSKEQKDSLTVYKQKGVYNVIGTLSQHWQAFQKFRVWAGYILGQESTLNTREREILILRTAWLSDCEYEWGQHVRIAKQVGLKDGEIEAIKNGPQDQIWHSNDQLLLNAVEELMNDKIISNECWQALARIYDQQQLMDIIFTVGQYNMVSMFLNSCGVQLDDGLKGF